MSDQRLFGNFFAPCRMRATLPSCRGIYPCNVTVIFLFGNEKHQRTSLLWLVENVIDLSFIDGCVHQMRKVLIWELMPYLSAAGWSGDAFLSLGKMRVLIGAAFL